jgi:hypothetical protein
MGKNAAQRRAILQSECRRRRERLRFAPVYRQKRQFVLFNDASQQYEYFITSARWVCPQENSRNALLLLQKLEKQQDEKRSEITGIILNKNIASAFCLCQNHNL